VQGRQRAHSRHCVVQDFGPKVAGEILASGLDGVRRPDVGAWRHGQDVGGLSDEKACRRGTGAARIDVHDDRHLRIQKARDDVVHRGGDAAWSVHDDKEGIGPISFGSGNRIADVGGSDRVDVACQVGLLDVRGGRRGLQRDEQGGTTSRQSEPQRLARAHASSMAIAGPVCRCKTWNIRNIGRTGVAS